MKVFKVIFEIFIVLSVAAILFGILFYFAVTTNAVLHIDNIKKSKISLSILDSEGNKLSYSGENDYATLDEIPDNLINAFVIMEDKRFYSHNGIDFIRIGGAMIKNITTLSKKEGASTITQQLIKNTHLGNEKTFSRKLKEMKLAVELEKTMSKDEIMESYLNVIYFGNGIYGVKGAAEAYFNKKCQDLTLAECAVIAGVVKNPSKYSPLINEEASNERKNLVLSQMYKADVISASDYEEAKETHVTKNKKFRRQENEYLSCVIYEASKILNISEKDLLGSNFVIKTYFDEKAQENLKNSFDNAGIPDNMYGNNYDYYGILCDNTTGGVIGYYDNTYYNAFNLRRQPGSVIKPFISYLPAISAGKITPSSHILDEKTDFDGYIPLNYNDKYSGWVSARYALAKSMNVPAVKLCDEVGIYSAIGYAEKYGLKFEEKDYTLASALGGLTKGLNAVEICGAYMTLANNGYYTDPSFIERISDKDGKTVYKRAAPERIETADNCFLMTDMLKSCVKEGTAYRLNSNLYDVAAKTGTVGFGNGKRNNDAWNASFTTAHTLCVWIGNTENNEENSLDEKITGSGYPSIIAKTIYDKTYSGYSPQDFTVPNNIVRLAIDKNELDKTHKQYLAENTGKKDDVIFDYFKKGQQPSKKTVKENPHFSVSKFEIKRFEESLIIRFFGEDGIKYDVIENNLFDEKTIKTVSGKSEMVEIYLPLQPEYPCEYYIKPYYSNYLDEIILGRESERILIDVTE